MDVADNNAEPSQRGNMRALLDFLGPHKKTLYIGIILGLAYAASSLVVPLITQALLDRLERKEPMGPAVIQLIVLTVAGAVLLFAQGSLLGQLGERIVRDARIHMVRRITRLRTASMTQFSPGEFVSRVTADTMLLREAASTGIAQVTRSIVTIIGALVFMAFLEPILVIATVVCIGTVVVVLGALMPRLASANERAQDAMGHVGGRVEALVRAIRTVKASRAEDREAAGVLVHVEESRSQGARAARTQAASAMVAAAGSQIAFLTILGIGAYRVSEGDIRMSTLIAFLLYIGVLTEPIGTFAESLSQTQMGLAAASRIQELNRLEVEQDIENPVRPRPQTESTIVKFDGVNARYTPGGKLVLRDIKLDISRKGHTAFVGPSGAGKTTLFSLLLRFIDPESGEIRMDGVPISRWALDELRQRIVYVEQEAPLLPDSVRANVAYTNLDATDDEIWHALRSVRLEQKVQALEHGLDTPLTNTILSGGERQRIAIARAIAAKPEVLLLDEATSQLDGVTEAVIHDCIKEISRTGAVLTIAHRLSTVVDADKIVVMEKGQVRSVGTHDQLMASDKLYNDLIAALRIGSTVGPAPAPPAPRIPQRTQQIPVMWGRPPIPEFPRHTGQLWPGRHIPWFGRRAGKHARAEGQVTWMDGVYLTVPVEFPPPQPLPNADDGQPRQRENGLRRLPPRNDRRR